MFKTLAIAAVAISVSSAAMADQYCGPGYIYYHYACRWQGNPGNVVSGAVGTAGNVAGAAVGTAGNIAGGAVNTATGIATGVVGAVTAPLR